MVLQQNEEVRVWGKGKADSELKITGSWGQETSTVVDPQGSWSATIKTPIAGGPYTLQVESSSQRTLIEDVMVGEVWLASGQSNMEMPLQGWPPRDPIDNSEEEVANARYEGIRMFTVAKQYTTKPIDSLQGQWEVSSPESAKMFSATAYFFARRVHQELKVPVGIIHTSWGGTPAEAWTSKKKLRELGDFNVIIESFDNPQTLQETEEWYGKASRVAMPQSPEAWDRADFGDAGLAESTYDDAFWLEIDLPDRFDEFEDFTTDGVFWFRKEFTITDASQAFTLNIGPIDDMDATFINGVKVGGMAGPGYWNVPRTYEIPSGVIREGKNVIAIRAIDTGGGGAVGDDITIESGSEHISLAGKWKFLPIAEQYQGAFYVYNLDKAAILERPKLLEVDQNTPTVLYNSMLSPVIPYKIKGAIWYQGESNVGRAEQYTRLFPAMITDWRERWGYDFPFYYVQIAPFRYHPFDDPERDQSQQLRDAQRRTLSLPNTGMVVTMDIGNFTNIHPGNKQDVGRRLAGLALSNDYEAALVSSGPLYKSHRTEGRSLFVTFDSVGSGLMAQGDRPSGFEIAGSDGQFYEASATIVDNEIRLTSRKVQRPVHVRYAWRDNGIASLYNKEGLPASSFSSQDLD